MTPAAAIPTLRRLDRADAARVGAVFARRLDHVGLRLGLPEALLGLLTALAADAPEISSAISALVQHEHAVAVGVVVGSNAFNLAAMLGLSAVVTGSRPGWMRDDRGLWLLGSTVVGLGSLRCRTSPSPSGRVLRSAPPAGRASRRSFGELTARARLRRECGSFSLASRCLIVAGSVGAVRPRPISRTPGRCPRRSSE